jgi:hypothetical protein
MVVGNVQVLGPTHGRQRENGREDASKNFHRGSELAPAHDKRLVVEP